MWVYKGVRLVYENEEWEYQSKTFVSLRDWVPFDWMFARDEEWFERYVKAIEYPIEITPIPNPPNLLPVGTKVRVFDIYFKRIKHFGNINNKEYVIEYIDEYRSTYTLLYNWQCIGGIPARAVVPVLD